MADKAIDIKGKKYVLVKDRLLAFQELYPQGSIVTEKSNLGSDRIVAFKATVTPNTKEPGRFFTGHAEEIRGGQGVNATSAVENAETSAVGRALAMLGIGILDSVASADEVHKATRPGAGYPQPRPAIPSVSTTPTPSQGTSGSTPTMRNPMKPASEAQKNLIRKLSGERGIPVDEGHMATMVMGQAKETIDRLLSTPARNFPTVSQDDDIPIVEGQEGPLPEISDDWLGQ